MSAADRMVLVMAALAFLVWMFGSVIYPRIQMKKRKRMWDQLKAVFTTVPICVDWVGGRPIIQLMERPETASDFEIVAEGPAARKIRAFRHRWVEKGSSVTHDELNCLCDTYLIIG